MNIIWSKRAYIRRQAIEDYILLSFGYNARVEFTKEVNFWKTCLLESPEIGPIEPILLGMQKEYRSIVIGRLSKCIYYVENDTIVIADWWDTRREPHQTSHGLQ